MSRLEFTCRHRYETGFELDVQFHTTDRVTTLFGPSGSGKTSVLSLIAGFLAPQSGMISLEGKPLIDTARGIRLSPEQRRVGIVFQDHLLFPHLSVEDNLRYGERRRKTAPGRMDFSRVVSVLELGNLLGRSPHSLSGGERQRVGIGRALLSRPELLLLDEPLASLDEALRGRILNYIERVVQEWNLPVLFVSHDQASVRRLAESVVVLSQGRVIASGKPADVLSQPEFLAAHDALGPVNLLRIERPLQREGHITGQVGTQTLHFAAAAAPVSDPVFVQFSPKDVMLSRQDVTGVSARNHLRGQVRQVVELANVVFLAIDIGQIIWAEVTREALAELDLKLGTEVVCLVKTTSLEVVG